MKQTFVLVLTVLRNGAKRIPMGVGFALAVTLPHLNATANEVNLGTANNFAVLAGSTVTSTGATVINGGNVGLNPGTSVTGFPPATITPPYTMQVANGVALQAENDLTTAYNAAAGFAPTRVLTGTDLGGLTLTPGVYFFASSAQLTGQLTLNDEGLSDPVFVFQIGSTLTTASDSSVLSINVNDAAGSDPAASIFWQVGSSATLGTTTDFEGNILANASITDDGSSTVDGRLLAEGGAVTLDDTTITAPPAEVIGGGGGSVPDSGNTLLLLGGGLAALFAFKRRFCVLLGEQA
jgi:hypothetical protein